MREVAIQDSRNVPLEVEIMQRLYDLGWTMAAAWLMATEVYPQREERGLSAWFQELLDD